MDRDYNLSIVDPFYKEEWEIVIGVSTTRSLD